MEHKLKCVKPYFGAVQTGVKQFELRKDDRNFQVGDKLILQEYDGENDEYSGQELEVEVIYKLSDYTGLEHGFCILGIRITADKGTFF